ncbi:hypothetical protein [Microbulbifer rhizosphaerae]|uniref:Uncharacterized protein n=1 Tax=Microbulbifer rhizosphaerae TaxID=1562603 RepID=A0A7W4WAJ9_9GAMM|nr:hypothetical protein [Microbulbifer rhizosphaerae]MBB3060679.1 hypothetical protein [Microbulbifer rhizosphaerae]
MQLAVRLPVGRLIDEDNWPKNLLFVVYDLIKMIRRNSPPKLLAYILRQQIGDKQLNALLQA